MYQVVNDDGESTISVTTYLLKLYMQIRLHRTGLHLYLTVTPNVGRWEKGPKCKSLLLNAGELAALLGRSHPGALTMVQLSDWTPRPTSTCLIAKPAVMSTPVKDQVLIYTPESREAIVCKFLA